MVYIHSVGNCRSGFANEVSHSGHHCNTTVHDLRFSDTLDCVEIGILGKTKRIKEAKRRDGTRKTVARKSIAKRRDGIRRPSIDDDSGGDYDEFFDGVRGFIRHADSSG